MIDETPNTQHVPQFTSIDDLAFIIPAFHNCIIFEFKSVSMIAIECPSNHSYFRAESINYPIQLNFDNKLSDPDPWSNLEQRALAHDTIAVIHLAARWAAIMQIDHACGTSIPDAAAASLELANIEKLAFIHREQARTILKLCWIHGDQLTRSSL